MKPLKKLLLNSLLILSAAAAGWCGQKSSQNNDWVITKDLLGASGSSLSSGGDYTLAFAWGEPVSGNVITESVPDPTYVIISGYIGGRFGSGQTLKLVSSEIGVGSSQVFMQNGVQVGVPFDGSIEIVFSDELDTWTIQDGVRVSLVTDHMGQSVQSAFDVTITTDAADLKRITIRPREAWLGNTLYSITLTPQLFSAGGDPLEEDHHIYFVTILDHRQENVVLEPVVPAGLPSTAGSAAPGSLSITIPTESLSDFSAVLQSRDPVSAPLRVDPQIIREANDKARAAGGPYRVPLAIHEISAYDAKGGLMGSLSKPAQVSVEYGGRSAPAAPAGLVQPKTLALWVLDEKHKLWVKMPASRNALATQTVSAPVAQFSVFALMGSAEGSTSDSFVFPVPWRPRGPKAGTDPGQTGTEAGGMTFSNLPPECTITIYTIAGERVRTLRHSDAAGTIGQEAWDGKTDGGDKAASGVYLWRVESSVDGKSGKLMIIR